MLATLRSLLVLLLLLTFTLTTALPLSIAPRDACSSTITKLVDGINKNIDIQKQEQSQTTVLQNELKSSTPSASDFASSQSKLVDIVNSGASQRAANQKLAPSGNAAIPGLKKVQDAQATELKMAKALTGNPDSDTANLKTLQTMFAGGIKQNQQNAKDAATGCTISD